MHPLQARSPTHGMGQESRKLFAKLTTRDCPVCDTGHALCCARVLLGERGRCCKACSHNRRHVVTVEWPDVAPPTRPPNQPRRGGASDDERLVRALLDRAETDKNEVVETFDAPSLSAYRSLASSRGVDLETVIRHARRASPHRGASARSQSGTNETQEMI